MNSIYLNGFSVLVLVNREPSEKIIYKDAYYYSMPNNTKYEIELRNDHNVRVDSHVWLHGKKLGVWRINPHQQVLISENLTLQKGQDGLLKVEFRPEKEPSSYTYLPQRNSRDVDPTQVNYLCKEYTDTVTPYDRTHRTCAMDTDSYDRYVESNLMPQIKYQFRQTKMVDSLENIDIENITTIYARLVVDDDRTTTSRQYNMMARANPTLPPLPLDLRHPSRPHSAATDSSFTLSKKYYFSNF